MHKQLFDVREIEGESHVGGLDCFAAIFFAVRELDDIGGALFGRVTVCE